MRQPDSSTASRPSERTTGHTYKLSCTDCSFETTVRGDVFDVYDAIDDHQEPFTNTAVRHFVNFEVDGLVDSSADGSEGQKVD